MVASSQLRREPKPQSPRTRNPSKEGLPQVPVLPDQYLADNAAEKDARERTEPPVPAESAAFFPPRPDPRLFLDILRNIA